MELHIKAAAEYCGVTERTLRYYDRIGLVCPKRTEANYRVYTETELLRLQEVLFYRSLDLPIAVIKAMLDDGTHDRDRTLRQHKTLLLARRNEIDRALALLETISEEKNMKQKETASYKELKARYREETLQRWGDTKEYRCSEEKEAARSDRENDAVMAAAEEIFKAFAALAAEKTAASDREAQALCARWQAHISEHHYPCTKQILSGLACMYIGDERFQKNLDAYGEGTAQFMHDALLVYCAE